ncbi:MAG: response regulator [Proteobacteria bacterium]|nr:response regulator [Pseudomonadota bacterium]
MFDSATLVGVICLYMGLLFGLALYVERKSGRGRRLVNNPIVYTLSLAVYCTSWTYYGSVGKAVDSSFLFLAIYLGPTLAMIFGWSLLRKLVRIKNAHRVTSIADLISARYDKSRTLAAVATVIALVGVTPYIALQLKAMISTFHLLSSQSGEPTTWLGHLVGPILVMLMILFTIMFGIRRIDPTERHPGMVMVIAVQSVVKLVAFLAVGVVVTFVVFNGFPDVMNQIEKAVAAPGPGHSTAPGYWEWMTFLVLAMTAFFFLPRQFHMAVVENFDERHIKTAMWLFPLYLLLINVFVFPIAAAGLLQGLQPQQADTFVLRLPLAAGYKWLSLFVFLGGFSAAASMIMISVMTLSTMVTNHLLLPLVESVEWMGFLRRRILECRWLVAGLGIVIAYWFERYVGESHMLVNMGMISFAAVIQFAPSVLGGLFWRRANKGGALWGLGGGFVMWFYTLMVPALVKSGWLPQSLLQAGPLGIGLLCPEGLLGLGGLDPLTHSLFWSLAVNVSLFIWGSLVHRPSANEQRLAEEFVTLRPASSARIGLRHGESVVDLGQKRALFENELGRYFPRANATAIFDRCLTTLGLANREMISILELAELHEAVEKSLAGSVGASTARMALAHGATITPSEARALSEVYADILAELKVTPAELKRKIDFHQEREELLRASEEKYRSLIENSPIGIRINQDGRYVYCNPRALEMFGFDDPGEIIGRRVGELYAPEDRRRVNEYVAGHLREGAPLTFEAKGLTKSGDPLDVNVSITRVTYEGRPANLAFVQDVSDRKRAEQEREDLQRQLAQAQKMEAVGTLAGGVAHDFNNILQVISGYAQLMLARDETPPRQRRYLIEIDGATLRAADLVQGLLTFSRKVDRELGPVDLNQTVVQTIKMLERTIPKMITIETDLSPDLEPINADPNQLEQVLMNLAANAKDAMPDGGRLVIATTPVSLDDKYSRGLIDVEPGRYSLLRFSDTGAGMDAETVKHVFEPFFTTKVVGQGTGLGLSTVYGIVKGHGGHITCYSEPGQGTTFNVYLPVADAAPATGDDDREAVQTVRGGTERILIVDDDEPVLDIAHDVLSSHGYKTITATSGEDALQLLQDLAGHIDLVILDLNMPGMGGRTCLNIIVERYSDMKVIVSSGYSVQPQDVLGAGAVDFIAKPYRLTEMLQKVRSALDGD